MVGLATAEKALSKTIALPNTIKGSLKVLQYGKHFWTKVEVGEKSVSSSIQASDGDIGAISVNSEGTLIASASHKGTVIKIFNAEGGELLQILRRGSSKANITGIVFHPNAPIIAICSDRTSIHLFEIKESLEKCAQIKAGGKVAEVEGENAKSKTGFLGVFSSFFEADLCLTKIKVMENHKIVAFDIKSHSLTVMSNDRTLYFFKIPTETTRYVSEAEIRTF